MHSETWRKTPPVMSSQIDIKIFGYCNQTPEELERLFVTHGVARLLEVEGEYVIVTTTSTGETWLVSSAEGYIQHFYCLVSGRFCHGPTVLDTFAQSRLPWHFDFKTLSDIALLESPLGDRTLHPNIKRVGPREIVHFDGSRLTTTRAPFEQLHPGEAVAPVETVRIFNQAVMRCVGPKNVLPISAGFDSRAILASCLAQGVRPNLLVCGFPNSTDVLAAEHLAELTKLPLERIELRAHDYLEHGLEISRLTSGAKSADHWHTFHYVHKSTQDRSANLLVGTNGEWARTHSLPLGFLATACDHLPPSIFHQFYWRAKLRSPFAQFSNWLAPEFDEELSATPERVSRLMSHCPGSVLEGLDRYYLEQRVRNFHSSGYKMYAANFDKVRMPFMDRHWIAATQDLPRELRLGSNWHRLAIHHNAPHLLQVPTGAISGAVAPKAPPFEWVSKGLARPVPYTRYREWFGSRQVRDFILANLDHLEPILQPDAVKEDISSGRPNAPIGLVLAFIFFHRALEGADGSRSI